MLKGYYVERKTTGREVYYILATSAEEATENWMDGELVISEVVDSEHYSTNEEEA